MTKSEIKTYEIFHFSGELTQPIKQVAIVLESNCCITCHFAKVIVKNENNLLFLMFDINSEMNHKLYYLKTQNALQRQLPYCFLDSYNILIQNFYWGELHFICNCLPPSFLPANFSTHFALIL